MPADSRQTDFARPASLRWKSLLDVLGPFVALGLVIVFFGFADWFRNWMTEEYNAQFLTIHNARTISVQIAVVSIAALGMTLVIIAGGIDLSVGSAVALCSTVLAWLLLNEYPAWMAISGCILTGCAVGCFNGVMIGVMRVVPFIVTLGSMTLFLGLAKKLANNETVRPKVIPAGLKTLLSTSRDHILFGIPIGVYYVLALAIVLAIILRYTVFGRYVFALGSNEATARLCGISVFWNRLAVYTLAGLFTGIAGIFSFSRLSQGDPTSGNSLELRVIAAVVIGGGSLSGGRGTVLGTLAGAALIKVIDSGCTQLGMDNSMMDIILGVTIITAVAFDQWRQRRL